MKSVVYVFVAITSDSIACVLVVLYFSFLAFIASDRCTNNNICKVAQERVMQCHIMFLDGKLILLTMLVKYIIK